MKHWRIWAILTLVLVVATAGLWAYWNHELRWRPHTIKTHQAEITKALEQAGWVSPGLTGPKLYMIGFRNCPECVIFKAEEFPKLHAAGVDTRVIEIARADRNGLAQSTPAERSTVAELWANRRWSLYEQWNAVPFEAWTAPGIPPADGDAGRTAIVEAGRNLVDDLTPLLKKNGIDFAYPTLVWWTKDGEMRGCACFKRESYRFVRKELGVAEKR